LPEQSGTRQISPNHAERNDGRRAGRLVSRPHAGHPMRLASARQDAVFQSNRRARGRTKFANTSSATDRPTC
jgi:hypothetical protein